ncbi:MAG: zinc-ribbon domain-containing protein [Anaerolineae bacterium]|jgi:RNA polymerase subunit RPABC4/transcription elongation factor Spt4/ElaB/YqjD/DUF883 family membrane-anchored ribosome-binding protein
MEDLLDRVRSGAGRVGFEAEKQRRVAQARVELRGLKGQVDEVIQQLGQRAMELYRSGQIEQPELREACEQVASLEAEIAQKKEEIEKLRAEEYVAPTPPPPTGRICPQCQISLPEQARFCPECGSEAVDVAPEPTTGPAPAERVCPNCGADASSEALFCPHCGTRLEKEEAEAT